MSHACRCEECREVTRQKLMAFRRQHRGQEPPVHGTRNGYQNYGCRCSECTEANRKG